MTCETSVMLDSSSRLCGNSSESALWLRPNRYLRLALDSDRRSSRAGVESMSAGDTDGLV